MLHGTSLGKLWMIRHVGGLGDVDLMSGHQDAILGHHHVGLDVIGAHANGRLVGSQGMFGQVAAGTPVGDDQHSMTRMPPCGLCRHAHHSKDQRQHQLKGQEDCKPLHHLPPGHS